MGAKLIASEESVPTYNISKRQRKRMRQQSVMRQKQEARARQEWALKCWVLLYRGAARKEHEIRTLQEQAQQECKLTNWEVRRLGLRTTRTKPLG